MSKKKEKSIYCGVDDLDKNQRRGTALECAELKQVRYYGLKKVSKDIANEYKGIPVESKMKEKRLIKMMGALKGKLELYKEEIKAYKEEDDYKKNKSHQKEVKILQQKLEKDKEAYNKIVKKIKDFRAKK